MGGIRESFVAEVSTNNDPRGIEVVVQRFALAQELRREQDVSAAGLLADMLGVTHGNGGLDHHERVGIDGHDQTNNRFYRRGVEVVTLRIVVSGRSYNNKLGILVRRLGIQRGGEVQTDRLTVGR